MAEIARRTDVLFDTKPASSVPPGVVSTPGLVCTNPSGPRHCPATSSQNPKRQNPPARESGRAVQRPPAVPGPAPAQHTATGEDRPWPRTSYPSAGGVVATYSHRAP